MNNEVRERLRSLTRKLADTAFAKACDDTASADEFRAVMDALATHLNEVRKRYAELHVERELV